MYVGTQLSTAYKEGISYVFVFKNNVITGCTVYEFKFEISLLIFVGQKSSSRILRGSPRVEDPQKL